jgi:ParB-like chromosome segregation protein Spo0J
MAEKIKRIRICDIKALGKRRALDATKVSSLAESMATLGQKVPITVHARNDGTLVLAAGLHRLKAAELLGWQKIASFVVRDKKLKRRLWANSENLHHNPLTKLDRAEAIANWVRDTGRLNKEAKSTPAGGNQPADKGISRTGKQLGFSRKTIGRALKVASISDKAKVLAKKRGLDRKQNALIDIAKERTPDAQLRKVRELSMEHERKAVTKTKSEAKAVPKTMSKSERRQLRNLRKRWKKAKNLRAAASKASTLVRRKFAGEVAVSDQPSAANKPAA